MRAWCEVRNFASQKFRLTPDAKSKLQCELLQTGPALSQCNRCSCIGPRASGAPRHRVWV